jgi:hypothetical protein
MSRMPQHTHPHGYLLLEKILVEILPKKDGIPAEKRGRWAKRANDSPQFWAALNTISSRRIALVAVGVLILHVEEVIGSVGMSGDLPDNDEACTVASIQKAGFEARLARRP